MHKPAGPWAVTGFAACQLLLLVPTLVVLVLVAIGGVLTIVTIGVPLLLVALPALRWIADRAPRHGGARPRARRAGRLPADRRTGGSLRRLQTWALDPMTWRDLLWALVSMTVGFALALLTVLLLVLVVTGALWWYGAPQVMRLRASLDRLLLTRSRTERLEQRVVDLTVSRAESVDHNAAELRRIERDLHDGAQARLVAVGMTLGLADDAARPRPGGGARSSSPRPATRRAPPSPTCATSCAGSTRRCSSDRGLVGAVRGAGARHGACR